MQFEKCVTYVKMMTRSHLGPLDSCMYHYRTEKKCWNLVPDDPFLLYNEPDIISAVVTVVLWCS